MYKKYKTIVDNNSLETSNFKKHQTSHRHCEEGSARRGNAAIKPRAESSSLELCRGGAG